jgi:hypothetical protein
MTPIRLLAAGSLPIHDQQCNRRTEGGPIDPEETAGAARVPPENPHIRFFESRLRGYTRCTVQHDRWFLNG